MHKWNNNLSRNFLPSAPVDVLRSNVCRKYRTKLTEILEKQMDLHEQNTKGQQSYLHLWLGPTASV